MFIQPKKPVHMPESREDGSFARAVSFEDYQRMDVQTRCKPIYRRKPAQIYATDNDAMRAVLVRFMERRAFGFKAKNGPQPGTDVERLERAHKKLLADVSRLDELATRLCTEYVVGRRYGARPEWLKKREG